jgi:hypothetical protein
MNIEFTTTLRGQKCTVFGVMLPPGSDVGIFGWHPESLTVTDAAGKELVLAAQEEEQIIEKCISVAEEQANDWDDEWL